MKKALPEHTDVGTPDGRNYGIDILRLVSMFYVILLHCLGQGGLLQAAAVGSPQHALSRAMEAFAYCAVDIFALISGYVSYSDREKKFKISSWLLLWLRVTVYGAAVMLIGKLIMPQAVTKRELFKMLLPVSNGLYWYFSAYTALFFFAPFLNAAIRKCSEKTLKKFFVVLFVLFSIFDNTAKRFSLAGGYSFIWLMLLYIMGAAVKKCRLAERSSPPLLIAGIVITGAAGWLWKLFAPSFRFFNINITGDLLVSYTSPTVLGASLMYVMLFSKLRVCPGAKKITAFAAPGAFAAYILNCHPFIWQNLMYMRFAYLADRSLPAVFLSVTVFSLVFLVFSVAADRVLTLFFELLHIRRLIERISAAAESAAEYLAERL